MPNTDLAPEDELIKTANERAAEFSSRVVFVLGAVRQFNRTAEMMLGRRADNGRG